jgi:hypothetical protein
MRYSWCSVLLIMSLVILSTALVFGQNGKITGSVKDASSGEAIIGANVVLEGTTLGGAADVNGVYYILNVPPGNYNLVASAVGYARSTVRNVRLGSDQIVQTDFSLRAEAIGLQEVIVEAQQRVIDQSQTSAKSRVTSEEFRSLPLREVYDLVQTSPSVYKGFVRGGKQIETKTLIDGIDVTDQFYASAADNGPGANTPYLTYNAIMRHNSSQRSALMDLTTGSVEEASVLTGGVGADYSSATAGIVSYSLREGRGTLSGGARFRMSSGGLKHHGPDVYNDAAKFLAEKNTLAASTDPANQQKAARYTWTADKYSYGEKPTMEGEVSFGGGLADNMGLYFTGGLNNSYGRLPNEFTRKINSTLKFNYSPIPEIRFNVLGVLEDQGELFGWKNSSFSEDFRFFLEGVPRWSGVNYVGSLKMTHILSPQTFYEVQASLVGKNEKRGYVDGNNDGVIGLNEDGDFLTFADTSQSNRYMANASNSQFNKFFSPSPRNESGSETVITNAGGLRWKIARPGLFYEDFENSSLTLKADLTSQVTVNHQLRTGLQARFHNFDRELRAAYIGGQFSAYKNYVEELWNVKPTEYSLYAQDKMEYAGLIINLGFRLDALDMATSDFSNYFAPFADVKDEAGGTVRIPMRGESRIIYIDGKPVTITDPDQENIKMRYFFSPRLGVSHPISDRAAMYFSFSRQTQSQPFSRLFTNYGDFGNPSLPVVVHAGQDPIKSTNYDLGLQWSFAEGYGLDVNTYYRDIENYGATSFQITPNAPWRLYIITTAFGYADSRGVELTVRKNLSPVLGDFLSVGGRFSYAYSYIKQAVGAGGNPSTFSTGGGDSAKYDGGLPFSDIKLFNTIEQNVQGGNSSLTGGYDRPHRFTYTLMMRFPYEIMVSSVGRFESGFYYRRTLGDPRARELAEGPWNKQVDLRVEKMFDLGSARVTVFFDMLNALDTKNILAFDASNVGQQNWERNGNPTGGDGVATATRPVTQDGSLIYDIPRELYFGLSVNF